MKSLIHSIVLSIDYHDSSVYITNNLGVFIKSIINTENITAYYFVMDTHISLSILLVSEILLCSLAAGYRTV